MFCGFMSSFSNLRLCGDVLEYAFPTVVGVADITPDMLSGDYDKAAQKCAIIVGLILLQNRTTAFLKRLIKKPRPSFPNDLNSFPSGHMMIAAQCATRVFFAHKGITPKALAVVCSGIIALSRYLPGKHDMVDLTAGGLLGSVLGTAWNCLLTPSNS
jgi:membrane-associated phospholipid phosphatase